MSVGAKHLEDKLSVIAKNSSPNASPVQLFVVRCPLFVVLPLTNHQSPITNLLNYANLPRNFQRSLQTSIRPSSRTSFTQFTRL
ncbi:MAG: hypothetical protein HEQ33_20930 [Dolichospermum sp. WA123]|nr:hypothetical protein [Dolichospermum sp. WA123]